MTVIYKKHCQKHKSLNRGNLRLLHKKSLCFAQSPENASLNPLNVLYPLPPVLQKSITAKFGCSKSLCMRDEIV